MIRLTTFKAEWCKPCHTLETQLALVAGAYPQVEFVNVDVDTQPEIAAKYRVMSVPTVLIECDEDLRAVVVGAHPARRYLDELKAIQA